MPFDAIHAAFGVNLPVPYVNLVPELPMVDKWVWYSALGVVYDDGPHRVNT